MPEDASQTTQDASRANIFKDSSPLYFNTNEVSRAVADTWPKFVKVHEGSVPDAIITMHGWSQNPTLFEKKYPELKNAPHLQEVTAFFAAYDDLLASMEDVLTREEEIKSLESKAQGAYFNQYMASALCAMRQLPRNDPSRRGYESFTSILRDLSRKDHPFGRLNIVLSGARAQSAVMEVGLNLGYKLAVPNTDDPDDLVDVTRMDVKAGVDVGFISPDNKFLYLVDFKARHYIRDSNGQIVGEYDEVEVKYKNLNKQDQLEARKQTVDEIKKLYKLGPNTRVIHVQIDVPTGDDFIGTDGNPQDTLYSQIDTAFKDLRSWNSNE